MPELVVVVPSRGRPHTVAELAEAFRETCELPDTWLVFAVDESDATWPEYRDAAAAQPPGRDGKRMVEAVSLPSSSMVEALNLAARALLDTYADGIGAIGFFGDDHRPRSASWDWRYVEALRSMPGIVYGDDLIQGPRLPTQCAMSTNLVRALGHMAPPVLHHLYLDNYWLTLGRATGCITYLPDVVVEHMHPIASKAEWDEGHRRVNAPEMYARDKAAFEAYWAEYQERDVLAARQAMAVAR